MSCSQKIGNIISKSWLTSSDSKCTQLCFTLRFLQRHQRTIFKTNCKTACFFGKATLMASSICGSFFPGMRQRCPFKDSSLGMLTMEESYSLLATKLLAIGPPILRLISGDTGKRRKLNTTFSCK